jgi:hypothetical protein
MATTKTKRKQIEQTEAQTILDSVKDIRIGDVVTQVNNLQVSVQKTLADLCSTVTTKVKQVEDVDTAIELKNQRLKELFGIEQEALTLEEMRAQRDQERLDWDMERQARQKRQQEEEAEYTKLRNRNEDNWKYEFEQRKKRAQEDFEAEIARTKRAEALRHETLERSWVERENALKAKEQEFQKLQAEVAGFEAKIAEVSKKGEASGYASASAKYNHEIALLKKDAEADKKVAEMRITALTSQIAGLENQIEDLQTQLQAARQDAKEVASEALKSASSRQLADTLQKVVTEGQQSTSKNK